MKILFKSQTPEAIYISDIKSHQYIVAKKRGCYRYILQCSMADTSNDIFYIWTRITSPLDSGCSHFHAHGKTREDAVRNLLSEGWEIEVFNTLTEIDNWINEK